MIPDPSMDQLVPQNTYAYYDSHMSSKATSVPTTGPINERQDDNGHMLRWMPMCAVQSIYPSVEGGLLWDVCTEQAGLLWVRHGLSKILSKREGNLF